MSFEVKYQIWLFKSGSFKIIVSQCVLDSAGKHHASETWCFFLRNVRVCMIFSSITLFHVATLLTSVFLVFAMIYLKKSLVKFYRLFITADLFLGVQFRSGMEQPWTVLWGHESVLQCTCEQSRLGITRFTQQSTWRRVCCVVDWSSSKKYLIESLG